jgi:hypothetical protein
VCAIGALALGAILLPSFGAQQKRGPFSEVELIRALSGDVPPKRVEELVRQYGVSFELTAQAETELRQAGATDELLKVIREAAPAAPPAGTLTIRSTPAGAQVYLDGNPAGVTKSDGELDLGQLSPGQHRLRVALTGYGDYSQTVTVAAGKSASIPVALTPLVKAPEAQPQPSPLHLVATFRVTHQHTIGSCEGNLIIGHGMLEYRADNQGRHSFASPLRDITYGSSIIGGGFYLRTKDGKQREFHSKSTAQILQILAYPANYQ